MKDPANGLHVSTEFHFKIGQATFGMSGTESTNAINNETVGFDRGLESLLTVPCEDKVIFPLIHRGVTYNSQVILGAASW